MIDGTYGVASSQALLLCDTKSKAQRGGSHKSPTKLEYEV